MGKILFWSPLHGQGQTSNIHAAAFIMSLLFKKKVLLMQTHYTKNNLEAPLVGQNADRNTVDENILFQDIGIDSAVLHSALQRLELTMLERYCLSFPEIPLLLLPGTGMKDKETFERDIGKALNPFIRDAGDCVDIVLIDSNSGRDDISERLMEIADLIVINLTQRRYVLEHFFAEYGEWLMNNDRVFFLFGDYDHNSSYNINNCKKKYKKYIHSFNSGVIPYSTEYMDAQSGSCVVAFMRKGLRKCDSNSMERIIDKVVSNIYIKRCNWEEQQHFFHHATKSVEKMLRMLSASNRKEDQKDEYV